MSILTGKTFVLTDASGYELNGGGGSFTNIRRTIVVNSTGQLIGDGLKLAIADVDTANVSGLVGYTPVPAVLNRTYAWQLSIATPDAPFTVNSLSVILTKAFRLGSKWGVALYNSTGLTRLLDTGPLDGTVTGLRTVAQSAVVLAAGSYWLALTIPPAIAYEDVTYRISPKGGTRRIPRGPKGRLRDSNVVQLCPSHPAGHNRRQPQRRGTATGNPRNFNHLANRRPGRRSAPWGCYCSKPKKHKEKHRWKT